MKLSVTESIALVSFSSVSTIMRLFERERERVLCMRGLNLVIQSCLQMLMKCGQSLYIQEVCFCVVNHKDVSSHSLGRLLS